MTRRGVIAATATVLATVVLLVPALRLGDADAGVPFHYQQDGLFFAMSVDTVIEQGWHDRNDRIGAPFGADLEDFPVLGGNNLDFLVIKAFGLFSDDFAVVENAYYLLTYVLVALAALLVLRSLGITPVVAGAVAILYSIAPYHLRRSEEHLMLSAYYCVPLACWLALRILAGGRLFESRRTAVGVVAACAVIGASSGSGYYAAFAVVLIFLAGVISLMWRRDRGVVLGAAGAAGLVVIMLALNLAPTLAHQARHGRNHELATRSASESENFGLKLAQMVLPVEGHRLESLAYLRERYARFPPRNESDAATLGTAATVGLGWLLIVAFGALGWPRSRGTEQERHLSAATLALILVATVGGGATLIALLATTQIRAWNRLSIFVMFFALAALALLLERLRPKLARSGRLAMPAVAVLLVVVGIADQASPALAPPHEENRQQYRSDRRFVTSIERRLPRGASIFQLPYVPFPEPPALFDVGTHYDHLRGLLHSRHLKWSGGSVKGRSTDWAAAHHARPLDALIPAVAAAGFSGVWIDRWLYGPAADAIQNEVVVAAKTSAMLSADAHFSFVDLRALTASLSPDQRDALRDETLRPIRVVYAEGFGDIESDQHDQWRWADRTSRLELHNPRRTAQAATVTIPVAAGARGDFTLRLTAPGGVVETVAITQDRSRVQVRAVIPPGQSAIRLTTNAAVPRPAPSQVQRTGRVRVFPVDVLTERMAVNIRSIG